MSRAFPFPPPGYVRNLAHGQDLVESTKLLSCKKEAKTELRKEKKIEKKLKSKERKEKKAKEGKPHKCVDGYAKKFDDKLSRCDSKQIENETVQLEKSDLTEELEQPQNTCYLSDGTQNNKRKREDLPAVENPNSQGKPLLVRFILKKPRESESVLDKELLSSTPGATSLPLRNGTLAPQEREARTNIIASTSTSESDERQRLQLVSQRKSSSGILNDQRKNRKTDGKSIYRALFEDWVPEEIKFQLPDDDNDQNWLFGSKKQEKSAVKRSRTEDIGCKSFGVSPWQRVQLIPDVGIYSLPYTIPF